MLASKHLRRARLRLDRILLPFLALVCAARAQIDLGVNPTVLPGVTLTLNPLDFFSGTLTVGATGQNNGLLLLATDYTTGRAFVFAGTGSQLSHSITTRTLTINSGGSITRTGAGSTTFFENVTLAGGSLTVNGGTLFASGALTNQSGGTISVTGSGSILNVTTLSNSGTLSASDSGQLRLTGNVTTANLGSPGNITITNGGVIELASGSVLTNTAANLAAPTGGTYLFNGIIIGGTIDANTLTQSNGTLDGAVISGNVSVASGKSLTLKNGGGWTGTATIGTDGQNNGFLLLASDLSLSSGLVFTGTGTQLTHSNTTHTLTTTGSITRTGAGSTTFFENIVNSGTLTVNGGTLFASGAITNSGAISVTGNTSILNLTTLANSGTLNADNGGQLRLTGNVTTANLGAPKDISITNGGVIELASNGILTNTSANLAAPVGGTYLFNGTIIGGTINPNALTQSNGTLDGAVISGNVTVASGKSLTLKNGAGWTDTATIGTDGQNNGFLLLASDLSLSSGLVFTGTGSQLTHSNSTHTLTTTGSITRTGAGSTTFFENIVNSGTLTVNGGTLFASGAITNSGAITVTGNTSILNLTTMANTGTLNADSGGQLRLTGNVTTANLGASRNISITNGGIIELASNGILTNTSANLAAPVGGTYLFNGTIIGGTIASNALTQNNGTLDGAVISGDVTVAPGKSLTLKNNGGWTGNATIGATGSNNGFLLLGTDIALDTGLIFLGDNSQLTHSNSTRTLTLSSTGMLTRTGNGSTSSFENIVSSGTLTVDGGTLFSSGSLTNLAGGTVTVSNGATLSQSGTFTNRAAAITTVTGTGSKLSVANLVNSGTLISDAGALLSITGNTTTSRLGGITLTSGGTVELASNSVLDNSSNTLTGPNFGASSYIFKGTITGGTIAPSALIQNSGTLDGAIITGNVSVTAGTTLTLKNDGGWTGTATVGNAGMNNGFLLLATDATLPTSVVFTGDNSQLTHTNSARTVTITSTGSAKRTGSGSTSSFENIINAGTITVDGGTLFSSGTLTNTSGGTVTVSSGARLSQTGNFTNQTGATALVTGGNSTLAVANLNNTGTLIADSHGLLSLTGNFTTTGLGNITLTHDGTVELASNSVLNNTASNLTGPNSGNASYIFKGTITGGTIASTALTQNSGTLDGAVISGDVTVPAGTSLTLKNGGAWMGNATIGTASQNNGFLLLASDATLDTSLVFTGSNSQLTHSNSARTLTISTTGLLTRTGNGTTSSFENIVNNGKLAVSGGTLFSSGTLTNQAGGNVTVSNGASLSQTGTFTNNNGAKATVTGAGSSLAVANLTNTGSLLADLGGLLSLTGNVTTSGLGSIITTNGGTVELASNSVLNNTSATLTGPNGGTGSYIFKGTIVGGTVDPLALTQNSGVLDNAIITGDVNITPGAALVLKNGANFTGTATIGATNQSNGYLYLGTDTTITTSLVFAGSNSQLSHTNSARTLTLSTGATLTRVGNGTTSSFENIVNSGNVTVSGGTFFSSGSFTNQAGGSVTVANGATFTQSSAAFTQTGGSLAVNGTFNPGSAGLTLQGGTLSGSGSIGGNVTVSGGTIAPGGANIGTLTLTNGTLSITSATAFVVDVGPSSADKLVFQNAPSPISLGTGLLSISLNVLNEPVVGTTYNILQVTSGGNGITGTFAGLPTSGSGFNYTYGSNTYFFTVNYQSSVVSLTVTPVPEPSTWALMLTGLALVGLHLRRRRK